jgi:hypothetical protein
MTGWAGVVQMDAGREAGRFGFAQGRALAAFDALRNARFSQKI